MRAPERYLALLRIVVGGWFLVALILARAGRYWGSMASCGDGFPLARLALTARW